MCREILLSVGNCCPYGELAKMLSKKGYTSIFNIEARLDQDIINYIKSNFKYNKDKGYYKDDRYSVINISNVNLNKKWIIEMYPITGNEYIAYLKLENEKLNYYGYDFSC